MAQIRTEIIEDFIKQHNLSKTSFCKMSKISLSTFEKIMKGDRHFRIDAILKLRDILKIPIQNFINTNN